MKTSLKSMGALLGAGLMVAMFAGKANAGCGSLDGPLAAPATPAVLPWSEPGLGAVRMMPVGFLRAADREPLVAAIVGLWKFTFTAMGNAGGPPDGTVIDVGYVTWHADRTEITNSGKSPASSSFCMGVWKPLGNSTYKLNHYALSWSPDGTSFIGPTNIREEVTLDSGANRFNGTFTIDQYDTTGTTVVGHVAGTVDATRVTVD